MQYLEEVLGGKELLCVLSVIMQNKYGYCARKSV